MTNDGDGKKDDTMADKERLAEWLKEEGEKMIAIANDQLDQFNVSNKRFEEEYKTQMEEIKKLEEEHKKETGGASGKK